MNWPALKRLSRNPRIIVLGDMILDRYTIGHAARISPEAPIPILLSERQEERAGGAASVATLLRTLDCDVHAVGTVGADSEGATLRRLLEDRRISTSAITIDSRPTTLKHRFVGLASGRHPQQILRVDREETCDLIQRIERQLLDIFRTLLPECDCVLISDYDKGVCTPTILNEVLGMCRENAIPVLIDPRRSADLGRYVGASLLKPNRIEAEAFAGRTIRSVSDALSVADCLRNELGIDAVLVTLDSDGMALATSAAVKSFPTRRRSAYDITGAGDTALAVLGYGAAARWPLEASVQTANIAAGLQVERFGVQPITWDEISFELRPESEVRTSRKICSLAEATIAVQAERQAGRRIVLTNGCFDLFHAGHLMTLREASLQGDVLIVAINSDDSVRKLKGPERPFVTAQQRAELIEAIDCVNFVLIFDEPTPTRLLRALRPDVLVKGGSTGEIEGQEVVEEYGGRVHRGTLVPGVSTTRQSQVVSALQSRQRTEERQATS